MTSQQGEINIERLCSRSSVSRCGYYRFLEEKEPDVEEMELRHVIQELYLEKKRRYGYRRITEELRIAGRPVNHKRVARLMRGDNLLAIQPRLFVSTTDSSHGFEVALNLAGRMTVTGVNQLWVADITYIRLAREFVFLAVVLDAYSRKVVGWSLGRNLKADLAIDALMQAIRQRKPAPGLVHHSDRGVQYACGDYAKILEANGITPSMSRPGNPYDNAQCESFMRTLKREEIRASCYRDIEQLRENLAEFIDEYYNKCRLHSALGYRSPDEYERTAGASSQDVATMRYFTPKADSNHRSAQAPAGGPCMHLDAGPAGAEFAHERTGQGVAQRGWDTPLQDT
jgi:putative transposase